MPVFVKAHMQRGSLVKAYTRVQSVSSRAGVKMKLADKLYNGSRMLKKYHASDINGFVARTARRAHARKGAIMTAAGMTKHIIRGKY